MLVTKSAEHVVWIGRNQPMHLGHLSILRLSLEAWQEPHVMGLVCQDLIPTEREAVGKFKAEYNPFTPWERMSIASTTLGAEGLNTRVKIVFVPRNDASGTAILPYLPPKFVRATTTKDPNDLAKAHLWQSQGYEVRVLDVTRIRPITSSFIHERLMAGDDWRHYLHPAVHAYFQEIDGPARLTQAAVTRFAT